MRTARAERLVRLLAVALLGSSLGACLLEFDPRLLDRLGPPCELGATEPLGFEHVPLVAERMDVNVVLEDLDGDADLDVVVAHFDGLPPSSSETGEISGRLFENRSLECGAGELVDVTSDWLPPVVSGRHDQASALIVVPLVDERPDIVQPAFYGRGRAQRGQDGLPRWSPTETFFVPGGDGELRGAAAAAGDLDGDGRLDLVLGGGYDTPGHALVTDDEGLLRDLGGSALLGETSRVWIADFDADGVQEVLTIPDGGPARLLRLEGDAFVADDGIAGIEHVSASGQVAVGDLDRDGDLDVFQIVQGGASLVAMVLENVEGTWTPRSDADLAGIGDDAWNGGNASPGFFIGLADLDLDGLLDLVMTDGRIDLYRNATSRTFGFERLDAARLGVPGAIAAQGSRVAVGDVDSDGDPDVAVTSASGTHLLRNTVAGAAWVRVRLRGPAGNARGVGALVCAFEPGMLPQAGCRGPGLVGMRVVQASSVQSEPLEALIAAPGRSRVDVRVVWPSGLGTTDVPGVRVPRGIWVGLP